MLLCFVNKLAFICHYERLLSIHNLLILVNITYFGINICLQSLVSVKAYRSAVVNDG